MFNKKVIFSIATVSILAGVILFSRINALGATTQQDASLKKIILK
jgi:hypothetical protein